MPSKLDHVCISCFPAPSSAKPPDDQQHGLQFHSIMTRRTAGTPTKDIPQHKQSDNWLALGASITKANWQLLLTSSHSSAEFKKDGFFLWIAFLSLYRQTPKEKCPCQLRCCGLLRPQQRPEGVVCYHSVLRVLREKPWLVSGNSLFAETGMLKAGLVPLKYKGEFNNNGDLHTFYSPMLVIDTDVPQLFRLWETTRTQKYHSLHWFFGHPLPLFRHVIDEDGEDHTGNVSTSQNTLHMYAEIVGAVHTQSIKELINRGRRPGHEVTNVDTIVATQESIRYLAGDTKRRKISIHHACTLVSTTYTPTETGGVTFALLGKEEAQLVAAEMRDVMLGMDVEPGCVIAPYVQNFDPDLKMYTPAATLRCTSEGQQKPLNNVHVITHPLQTCPVYPPPLSHVCVLGTPRPRAPASDYRHSIVEHSVNTGMKGHAEKVLVALLGDQTDINQLLRSAGDVFQVIFAMQDVGYYLVRVPNLPILCANRRGVNGCIHRKQHYAIRFNRNTWRVVCWHPSCSMSQINFKTTKDTKYSEWKQLAPYIPSGTIDYDTGLVTVTRIP